MNTQVTVNLRVRVILLSSSILCALLPAALVILATKSDFEHATLAHDAAAATEAASQVAMTIATVERQLEAFAVFVGTSPDRGQAVASLLRAVKASNSDVVRVGLLSGGSSIEEPAGGREPALDGADLPVYHPVPRAPYVSVAVPVDSEGGMLAAALSGTVVTARLHALAAAPGADAFLFTADGRLLASSGDALPRGAFTPLAGKRISQRVVADGRGLAASRWYATEVSISGTSWVLLLQRPVRALLPSRFPAAFGGASVLFAALLALFLMMILRRSAGGPTKRRLRDTARRNEMLLREMHHRVKNDLQILSSMLHLSDRPGLQAGEHEILAESQNRVHAISLIHEMLYKSIDIGAGVSMRGYVSELIKRIETSLVCDSESISIVSNVGDFSFDADTSVACGLLLNEMLTNSLKYAFPEGDSGIILVRMERIASGRYLMQVQDDGVGLPKECRVAETGSLGMRLIDALVEQLGGTIRVETEQGTIWTILFDAEEISVAAVR